MMSTTTWPRSWNSRSLRSTTVWPRWTSGAVGSRPSFTRSGRPSASLRSSAPAGRQSTASRARKAAWPAGDSVTGPMLESGTPVASFAARRQPRCRGAGSHGSGRLSLLSMSVSDRPDIMVLPEPPMGRPRLKRLRLALILFGLSLLALVSTAFGMMMAVTRDLPQLENRSEFNHAQNSLLTDVHGDYLATLADQGRIIIPTRDIAPAMQHAIIAIEDQRFYENQGVDLRGTARALWQDLTSHAAVQGGSTITQQFVKNATRAQQHRTIVEKVREALLAYHLTRKWSKEKILTEYLNSIYFGNGAYGIESAARTYFGQDVNHRGCGKPERRCAKELKPYEAAMLAGLVASPTAYDPVADRRAATRRRNLVLTKMLEQGYLTRGE